MTAVLRSLAGLLLLVGACHRAEIDLNLVGDEPQGGAPMMMTNMPAAGASVFPPLLSGRQPDSAAAFGEEPTPTALSACLQPLEPLQAECVFLGNDMCKDSPLAGELRACVGACVVCQELLADYPYYFAWHPCCEPAAPEAPCAADDELGVCDGRCPPPSEHDKLAPCDLPDGEP